MADMKNKARVLLLNPPTAAVSGGVLLNLAYLAAALRKAGHEVKIVDTTAPYNPVSKEGVRRIVADFRPHFIGVTLTIVYIVQTYAYLRELRELGVPIIAGGPHPNGLPEEALENGIDIVAIGEGEETVLELAEYFLGNKQLHEIAGLCFKKEDGKSFYTPRRRLIENLDALPFPDFRDFPIRNYTGTSDVNSNPLFWSIFSSRGCPFNCIFCSSHNVFGRIVRTRSARNVFDEILSLVNNFGAEKITFQDDEILCSKQRFLELCELIADSKIKVNMSIRTRIDSIDKELLEKCKSVGLTRMSFGIDSFNDDTLGKINKNYKVAKIRRQIKLLEEAKFPFVAFNLICGFPWETKEHFRANLKQMAEVPRSIPYFTEIAAPIPYPRTELYDKYHEQFGFTDWWLDVRKNGPEANAKIKPFFMHFGSRIAPLYVRDIFWGYSKEIQRELDAFDWKLFKILIRRHYAFGLSTIIIMLSRISYSLWKISPAIERFIFKPFNIPAVLRLKERLVFATKY